MNYLHHFDSALRTIDISLVEAGRMNEFIKNVYRDISLYSILSNAQKKLLEFDLHEVSNCINNSVGNIDYKRFHLLLIIFEELSKQGVEPFNSLKQYYFPFPEKNDYGSLPIELKFLAPYIEDYGMFLGEGEMLDIINAMSDQERTDILRITPVVMGLEKNIYLFINNNKGSEIALALDRLLDYITTFRDMQNSNEQ